LIFRKADNVNAALLQMKKSYDQETTAAMVGIASDD
jgi:hypothetical protein